MSKQLVVDRVIRYLTEDILVPMEMIDTDVKLSEFDENYDGDITIDIVVNVKDEDDYLVPVMVINCLDEDISLEGEVLEKQLEILEEIDNVTLSGRAILTNGDEMFFGDWTGEEYETENSIPKYDVMVEEFHKVEKAIHEHNEAHIHGEGCGCGCEDHHHHE